MLNMIKRVFAKKQQPRPRAPRKYQVPDGLVPEIIEAMDDQRADRWPVRATYEMWRLLEERCPECREGRWSVRQDGSRLYLIEKI